MGRRKPAEAPPPAPVLRYHTATLPLGPYGDKAAITEALLAAGFTPRAVPDKGTLGIEPSWWVLPGKGQGTWEWHQRAYP